MTTTLPSPSQQFSHILCPGYLSDGDAPSAIAERGTLLHKACELNRPNMAEDENDRNLVLLCLEHRNLHLNNLVRAQPTLWGTKNWRYLRLLKELHLPALPGTGETGGTIDCVAVPRNFKTRPPRIAALFDYKFGYKPVPPAVDNPQIISYVMRLFSHYPGLEWVDASILIPALRAGTNWLFSRRDATARYHAMRQEILDNAGASEDPQSYHPGTACTYCSRRASCPALRQPFLEILKSEHRINLSSLPLDTTNATTHQLSALRTLAGMMGDTSDAIKKAVDDEVKVRDLPALPEYKRVNRKGSWVITDPHTLMTTVFRTQLNDMANLLLALLFGNEPMTTSRFFEKAMKFLNIVLDIPVTGDYEYDWTNQVPASLTKQFLEEKPGSSYLAKVPKRGYVEMLESVMDYNVLHTLIDTAGEDVSDPTELVDDTTDTTDTTDTDDTTDTTETAAQQ